MSSNPSEGVFFVLRLPKCWQLCTCRHDEYGPLGLPDFWVEALGSFLNIWLSHFLERDRNRATKRHAALEQALGQIVAGYDAFPRGEVKRGEGRNRYVVHYSGELTRAMDVTRREVEDAFGIRGCAKWVADKRLASARDSAERLRKLLPIKEQWEKEKRESAAGTRARRRKAKGRDGKPKKRRAGARGRTRAK
jgi:hypothetical protein